MGRDNRMSCSCLTEVQRQRRHHAAFWQDEASVDDVTPEPTALHVLRLEAVHDALRACGARSVADLGCGDGALVKRLLADPHIVHIVAIDSDLSALARLERATARDAAARGRLRLLHGSFVQRRSDMGQPDAAVMVETIEHVALTQLSSVEQQVFGVLRPTTVIVTTPNQEFNVLYGMAPGQMREPGHQFEWTRQRFRAWAAGVALRRGYGLKLTGIGMTDPHYGSPTQMAQFTLHVVRQDPEPAGWTARDVAV